MAVGFPCEDDLFAKQTSGAMLARYRDAFDTWVASEKRAGRLRRPESADVYAHMWSALAAWATGLSIDLDRLDARDLEAYLASRGHAEDLTPRYALRLLQLVDRVFRHRQTNPRGLVTAQPRVTPAEELLLRRPEIRFAGSADQVPPPAYLDAPQARRLVAFLGAVRPDRGRQAASWQEIRNRTGVALMLGGGLTPGEVRALTLKDVVSAGGRAAGIPWKLLVEASSNTPAREAPLAAWAGRLLAHWLDIRQAQGIPGTVLLPSTRSTGKVWSKQSQYVATAEVLQAAGLDDIEGGSFRLRHTFAIRQLRRGRPPQEVARWLGIVDLKVMDRYQRVLPAAVDVV